MKERGEREERADDDHTYGYGSDRAIPGLPTLEEMLEGVKCPGERADIVYSYINGFLIPTPKDQSGIAYLTFK